MTTTQQGKLTDDDDLAHQIACELASIDGYDPEDMHCGLYDLRWSGGSAPEPLGDTFSLEYLPKGYRIARAIERALNQRLAVKEGDAVVRRLIECRSSVAFDLRNYEQLILRKGESVNQCDHDEANRLQSLLDFIDELIDAPLSTHPVSDDKQAKDAAITALLACKEVCSATGAMKEVGMAIDAIAALAAHQQDTVAEKGEK